MEVELVTKQFQLPTLPISYFKPGQIINAPFGLGHVEILPFLNVYFPIVHLLNVYF